MAREMSRNKRCSPSRHKNVFCCDFTARRELDGVAIVQRRPLHDELSARRLKIADIDLVEPVDLKILVFDQRGPIKRHLVRCPAEADSIFEFLGKLGSVNEKLLGHTATDDAGATDAIFFCHRNLGAMFGSDTRGAHTAGTCSNHEKIVVEPRHLRVISSTPWSVAIMTMVQMSMNRPTSMTPGMIVQNAFKTLRISDLLQRQINDGVARFSNEGLAVWLCPQPHLGIGIAQRLNARSIFQAVGLTPNFETSTGNGNLPSCSTLFESIADADDEAR